MAGMQQVREALEEAVPGLEEEKYVELYQELQRIGVATSEDLQYVREGDLKLLTTIQARKAISYWGRKTLSDSSAQSGGNSSSTRVAQTSSTSDAADETLTATAITTNHSELQWAHNLQLSANSFSFEIKEKLEKRDKLRAKSKRQLVREFVDLICRQNSKPSKKAIEHLANRMVHIFPSLLEQIDGCVIGSGSNGLANQISRRIENEARKTQPPSTNTNEKRKSSGLAAFTKSKKPRPSETYGCIRYSPSVVAREQMIQFMNEMIKDSAEGIHFTEQEEKLKTTYSLQREQIVAPTTVSDLLKNWPFLFTVKGFDQHFRLLVGKSPIELIGGGFKTKAERILRYFEQNAGRPTLYVIYEIERTARTCQNGQPASAGTILALLKYFSEDEDALFDCNVEFNDVDELDNTMWPAHPCLIVWGSDPMTAPAFTLAVDKVVCIKKIKTISLAISALFAAYYIFGIQYPKKASQTLEFIQRYFMSINPERGTKTGKRSSRSCRVFSLMQRLGEFNFQPDVSTSVVSTSPVSTMVVSTEPSISILP